jgi:hypothetical protein
LLCFGPVALGDDDKLPEKYRGQKVLVLFARADTGAEEALKKAKVAIMEQITASAYLIDCGKEKPREVVEALPGHQGAIVFGDGEFKEAIGYLDRRKRLQVPQPYASVRWGSTANDQKRMQADVDKFSKMPGVKAEHINTRPGEKVIGNPWMLRLTPAKGKTLLEVFVLTRAGFDYKEMKDGQ